MESLKQELLQSQKTRNDLMKWKLLLVSAIGSIALGFSGQPKVAHPELGLCVIPFVCCYVDLLCRNLSIRTKLLSAFLAAELTSTTQDYTASFEKFYQLFDAERKIHGEEALEGLALVKSTKLICLAVFLVGITNYFGNIWDWDKCLKLWSSLFFWTSGIGGFYLSNLVEERYKSQKEYIQDTLKKWELNKHRYFLIKF